jgi:hypothetical protein
VRLSGYFTVASSARVIDGGRFGKLAAHELQMRADRMLAKRCCCSTSIMRRRHATRRLASARGSSQHTLDATQVGSSANQLSLRRSRSTDPVSVPYFSRIRALWFEARLKFENAHFFETTSSSNFVIIIQMICLSLSLSCSALVSCSATGRCRQNCRCWRQSRRRCCQRRQVNSCCARACCVAAAVADQSATVRVWRVHAESGACGPHA